jgi:hypothetical protein
MVERRSHVAEGPDRRLGTEWFLDAVFPNGKTVSIRASARASEANFLSSSNENARASGSSIANGAIRTNQASMATCERRGFGVQTCLAVFGWSIELACGLAFLVSRPLIRLRKSPWFPLLCAGVSFAVLLLLTGAFTGMALTKQPGRTNMTAESRIEAITSREKSQPVERNFDSDLIAVLIELTAREEIQKQRARPPAVPLLPPRILLDARSFATVPLNDGPTNGYFD